MYFLDNNTDRQVLNLLTKSMSNKDIEKSLSKSGLVQVERTVSKPGITPFRQKFWVRPDQVKKTDIVLHGKVPNTPTRAVNPNLENAIKQFNGTMVNGQVSFKNPADEIMFKQHLKNLNNPHFNILDKWSKQGTHQATIDNFVDPKDLTPQQRSIGELGKQLGTPILFFKGSEELNGAHANGITYLNVDSKVDPHWTFWHESGHWLKAQYPDLVKDVINNLNITKIQINAFREHTQRYDLSDDEVREEIFADNMFDANKRLDILQTLHKKDTNVLDRLVSWLKSTMDKVISHFTTSKYGLTRNQQNQMFKELNDVLSHIKDNNTPRYATMKYSDTGAFNFQEMKAVRDKYEGTDKWLKAPNGQPTNLTEKQWLMVRTPSFKKWFGDWESDPAHSSSIVDNNSEPLVVYHGARQAGHTVFDDYEGEKASDAPVGTSWFTNDFEVARSYSGAHGLITQYGEDFYENDGGGGNYACFLNIREPAMIDFEGAHWDGMAYGKTQILDEDDIPITNAMGKTLFDSEEDAEAYAQEMELEDYTISTDPWIGHDTNSVVQEALQGDYGDNDGVIIYNVVDTGGRTYYESVANDYIVFNPNQIKSAVDNVGTFDVNNPDIRFSMSKPHRT